MKLEYYSEVKDGHLSKSVRNKIASELQQFNGKRVEIRIEKLKSKRSIQQNRYWWLAMTILSSELGYTKEEIHSICKMKFLKREKVVKKTGEILEYTESTTTLSKSDFADMVTDMVRWAAESLNIVIPLPGEQLEFETD
jgi:hypothetical protein